MHTTLYALWFRGPRPLLQDISGEAKNMVKHFSCCNQKKNHCSHMIATLRESKTRLSELVNLANSGEEILITVHGQPKARILSVSEPRSDTADWLRELSALRSSLGQPSTSQKPSALDEVREDRW